MTETIEQTSNIDAGKVKAAKTG
ncbi:MAG: hypothetical protein RL203_235, partial [Pseudomonadota bacterium]